MPGWFPLFTPKSNTTQRHSSSGSEDCQKTLFTNLHSNVAYQYKGWSGAIYIQQGLQSAISHHHNTTYLLTVGAQKDGSSWNKPHAVLAKCMQSLCGRKWPNLTTVPSQANWYGTKCMSHKRTTKQAATNTKTDRQLNARQISC